MRTLWTESLFLCIYQKPCIRFHIKTYHYLKLSWRNISDLPFQKIKSIRVHIIRTFVSNFTAMLRHTWPLNTWLNTWSESCNKRATLSGVAKITLKLRRFQERSFKLEMKSSIFVEITNSDGCNICFLEYLFVCSLFFIPLFTVDKASKFPPSHTPLFNNLSRISLPNMLGFIKTRKYNWLVPLARSLIKEML